MTNRTEWELVDAPSPGERPSGAQAAPALGDILKALLGAHWRWKIAGAGIIACLALVLAVTLAGVAILLVAAVAILSVGIGKLRRWLGRGRQSLIP